VSNVFAPVGWEVDDYADGRPLKGGWADVAVLECSLTPYDSGLVLAREIR
jgi:hypothetical protein